MVFLSVSHSLGCKLLVAWGPVCPIHPYKASAQNSSDAKMSMGYSYWIDEWIDEWPQEMITEDDYMETIASIIPLSSILHPQEVCKWNSFRNHIWTSFCLSTPRLTADGHKTLPTGRWVEVDCCSWGRPTSQGSLMQLCLCSSLLLLYGVPEPSCVCVSVRTCRSGGEMGIFSSIQ